MSKSVTLKQAAIVVIVLAVLQFAIQASLLLRGVKYAAASLTIDDTYYYLQTAWNTKQLGFVTFDGLHNTNGVQILWFAIILLLAFLVKTKISLLFATLIVSFILNGLCYFIILKIGAALKRPSLALIMASLWCLQSLPFRIYSTGMENSLHAFVFWCAIWQSLVFINRVRNGDRPNFLGLTIILILNAWSRLDSALLSAVLYFYCMAVLANTYRHNLRFFLQKYLKTILATSILAGFGLVSQLAAFRFMGDSFLPVSALVKTDGAARGLSSASLDKFVEVLILGMPSILQGRLPVVVLILFGVSGIVILFRLKATLPSHMENLRAFIGLWLSLLIGDLLYHTYIAVSGVTYMKYFTWYRSPSFIFWNITASLVALFIFERIRLINPSNPLYIWAPVGFCLIAFSIAIYMFARSINFTSDLYAARYETALWISENSQPETIFASWNAGQLGFFSNRAFINLDGVINNVDYYQRVLHGSTSIIEYLSENNVAYLVDYATYGSVPEFPILHSFPVDDGSGRSIQIWQVSPQVSSVR